MHLINARGVITAEGREHSDRKQKCALCIGDMHPADASGLNCGDLA